MAEYKKKTVKKSAPPKVKKTGKKLDSFSTVKKDKEKKSKPAEVPMKPKKERVKTETKAPKAPRQRKKLKMPQLGGMRLLLGKKGEIQKKRVITLIITAVIILSVIIFSVATPTGPFEYIENKVRTFGGEDFPAELSGSELYDGYASGSVIYTLSDTHAEIFSKSGKNILSRQHDFNSPVLSTSSQRAIVYDAGGKILYVYNYGDVVDEFTMKKEIYCADISRNGTIAVATKSDGYASEVQVISKSGKVKFVWYSATEIVNNIALSNNGKRLAVSTVDTSGGNFKSKVYVFKYSKAKPIYEFTYEGSVVYSLNTLSSSRFSVVTDKTVDFIKWRGGSRVQHENQYTLNLYRVCSGKNIAVLGNKSNNTVRVFNKKGEVTSEFEFLGAVTDIYYCDGRIFILSDGYLYTLNKQGESVAEKVNFSGYSRIFATDSNTVIAAGNFGFDEFNIK